MYEVLCWVYYALLGLVSLLALVRFRVMELPGRFICGFIWLGILTETIGAYWNVNYKTNIPVYNISCLLELLLVSLYFNFRLPAFRKVHLGIWLAGVAIGVLFIGSNRSLRIFNANFLFLECILIVLMSFYAIYKLLNTDIINKSLNKNFHFWLPLTLVFYQVGGFMTWGLYFNVGREMVLKHGIIRNFLVLNSILTYGALVVLFLLYPRLEKLYARE